MQLEPGTYDYKHVFDGLNKIIRNEGVDKLFLGGSVMVVLSALDLGLTFGFYEYFMRITHPFQELSEAFTLGKSFVNGILAASVAGIITNPPAVLATRMQMVDTTVHEKERVGSLIKKIYQHEGVLGFMKGVTGRIALAGLGASLFFPLYESLKIKYGLSDSGSP